MEIGDKVKVRPNQASIFMSDNGLAKVWTVTDIFPSELDGKLQMNGVCDSAYCGGGVNQFEVIDE